MSEPVNFRGKNKKPTMKLISLRLDKDIYDYFKSIPTPNLQSKIRGALREYILIKEKQND
jgi:uncharacterized protein (DUF4415 family)